MNRKNGSAVRERILTRRKSISHSPANTKLSPPFASSSSQPRMPTAILCFTTLLILLVGGPTETLAFAPAFRQPLDRTYSRSSSTRKAAINDSRFSRPRSLPISSTRLYIVPGTVVPSLPSATAVIAATFLPSSLGFIQREYGVSYGYGLSMFSMALLVARNQPQFWSWHMLLHAIYGLRLATFLFVRQVTVPYFQELKDRIEDKGPRRWSMARLSFIVQCAILYGCMSSPLFLSALTSDSIPKSTLWFRQTCLAVSTFGLLLQVIGDTHKYISKTFSDGDGNRLITTGVFQWFRHPNYTGEMILWGGSTLAGLTGSFLTLARSSTTTTSVSTTTLVMLSLASLLGYAGIFFVLRLAGRNLEKRHLEKYGSRRDYKQWKAWKGIV